MNAVGVIVEYNPFHNGHAFHLQEAKNMTHADIAIAVMSGNFLQRGEPALVSKWKRTEMALKAGVDIVFELPYAFAVQQADTFASGAVSILEAAGCRSLCFGSESGNIDSFYTTLSFLKNNNDEYQKLVKFHLKKGYSYPKASSLAFKDLCPGDHMVDLSKPNNILGYQYLSAVKKQKAAVEVLTVARKSADYHDNFFASESIASATSIRKALFSAGQIDKVKGYVPASTYHSLVEYQKEFGLFHEWELYWPYLKFRLIQSSPESLKAIYEVEEGLENRIIAAALEAGSFHEFMEKLKTKRYTWTRLQRTCVHILTNTTKNEMSNKEERASYLRLLGMTSRGRDYLNKYKSMLSLPLISRVAGYDLKHLKLDIRAARIFAMGASGLNQQKLLEVEFKQPPLLLD